MNLVGTDRNLSVDVLAGFLVEDAVLELDRFHAFGNAVRQARDGELGKVHLVLAKVDDLHRPQLVGSVGIKRVGGGVHGSSSYNIEAATSIATVVEF